MTRPAPPTPPPRARRRARRACRALGATRAESSAGGRCDRRGATRRDARVASPFSASIAETKRDAAVRADRPQSEPSRGARAARLGGRSGRSREHAGRDSPARPCGRRRAARSRRAREIAESAAATCRRDGRRRKAAARSSTTRATRGRARSTRASTRRGATATRRGLEVDAAPPRWGIAHGRRRARCGDGPPRGAASRGAAGQRATRAGCDCRRVERHAPRSADELAAAPLSHGARARARGGDAASA